MSAIDAVREINSLGLRVRLRADGNIRIDPPELAEAYRAHVTEIIAPVREEVIDYLQDGDQAFLKLVETEARARGYRVTQHRPGERPRRLV